MERNGAYDIEDDVISYINFELVIKLIQIIFLNTLIISIWHNFAFSTLFYSLFLMRIKVLAHKNTIKYTFLSLP
jgi:hypothetical protein